jgi:hypothetical protein
MTVMILFPFFIVALAHGSGKPGGSKCLFLHVRSTGCKWDNSVFIFASFDNRVFLRALSSIQNREKPRLRT